MLLFLSMMGLVTLGSIYINTEKGQTTIMRTKRAEEMRKYINDSVDPCVDFYDYACGHWPDYHPIPSDDVETFEMNIISTKLLEQVVTLVKEPISDEDWPTDRLTKDFYASCVDMEQRRKIGLTPFLDLIKSLGGWPALDPNWSGADFNWIEIIKTLKAGYGIGSMIDITIERNIRNNAENVIYIVERKTTLPNKDFYYDPSKSYHLNAYKDLIFDSLKIFGVDEQKAEQFTEEIVKLEGDVARGTVDSNLELNLDEVLVPTTVGQLQSTHPGVDWTDFIEVCMGISVNDSTNIVVGSIFLSNLLDVMENTNQRIIANYVMWSVAYLLMQNTDDRFDAIFHKYSEATVGSHSKEERWKKCLTETKEPFATPLGSQYVRKYFNDDKEKGVREMSEMIKDTFKESVEKFAWVDDISKEGLHRKLDKLEFLIGYPKVVLDKDKLIEEYEGLDINRENYFENQLNFLKFLREKARKSMQNNKVDDSDQFDTVTANAYLSVLKNKVYITAGILQYPYYSSYWPKVLNFAHLGTILGHELLHAFDDTGRKFDENGNMINWWTESTTENFLRRTKCFVEQYNNYTFLGKSLRGLPSLGENIADNGGLAYAYKAYQNWLDKQEPEIVEEEHLPGLNFTRNQLFFLSYAQTWCMAYKPEAMRARIDVDTHTPHKYRIIGTLQNSGEFSKEFNCPLGSPMNPEHKCKLW